MIYTKHIKKERNDWWNFNCQRRRRRRTDKRNKKGCLTDAITFHVSFTFIMWNVCVKRLLLLHVMLHCNAFSSRDIAFNRGFEPFAGYNSRYWWKWKTVILMKQNNKLCNEFEVLPFHMRISIKKNQLKDKHKCSEFYLCSKYLFFVCFCGRFTIIFNDLFIYLFISIFI